eukprot:6808770-Alexandrium_andersonii.AAC.1
MSIGPLSSAAAPRWIASVTRSNRGGRVGRVGVEHIAEALQERVAGLQGDILGLPQVTLEPQVAVVRVRAISKLEPLVPD